jgi:CHAD domain-containing protein
VSYRLESGEGVADGIRRIVAEELDDAIAGLRKGAEQPAQGRDKAIHEARKSLKKSRSALRLVREDLKASTRRDESAAMRDAGRRLSGARDAQVMLDTLAKVAHKAVPPPPPEEVRTLQRTLEARRDALAAQLEGDTGLLGDVAAELAAIRERVPDWRMRDQGHGSVVAGAEVLYARGREAMGEALRDGDDETWHEWRKRVKDLWYAGRILQPIADGQLDGTVDAADELSDVLGDHNDLAVLLEAATAAEQPGVCAAIVLRRNDLRRRAAPIGRRLYAERPKAFAARLAVLLEAHEAGRAAHAHWIGDADAAVIRDLLAQKPAADPAQRRHIAAGLRRRGLRVSDFEKAVPRRQGGFAAEDFELLVQRGIVRVGSAPDPASLAGL